MAIYNPSRVEIIPPHQLQLQLLQPSTMAPPSHTTASPRRGPMMVNDKENPFLVSGRYGGPSKGGPGVHVPSNDDVFFVNPAKKPSGMDSVRRQALGDRDTNDHTLTPNNAVASGSTSKSQLLHSHRPPVPVFHTSIPKPSPVPDVFSHSHHSHSHTTAHTQTTGIKRSAETLQDGDRNKRRVLEDVRTQDQRAARLDEQEKWKLKWMKSFPTLTFHFEMGAQLGPGKGLVNRTTKMGAVSRLYFVLQ